MNILILILIGIAVAALPWVIGSLLGFAYRPFWRVFGWLHEQINRLASWRG